MPENNEENSRHQSLGWRSVVSLFWLVTLLSSCAAIFMFYFTMKHSNGAPQQAAGAAIAIALVVIPYVITRAIEGIRDTMI